MTRRDWKEITIWAGVTTLMTTGIFGARMVMSADNAPQFSGPPAIIDGCRITAAAVPPAGGTIDTKVRIVNTTTATKNYSFQLALVQQEFTGNPASRVVMPGDYTNTTLDTEQVTGTIAGSATKDISIPLPLKVVAPARSTKTAANRPADRSRNISYLITVKEGTKATTVAFVPVVRPGKS